MKEADAIVSSSEVPRADPRPRLRGHPVVFLDASGRHGLENHGDTVHAVAKPGRLRTVIEDVTEMAAAAAAIDSRPQHAKGYVSRGADRVLQRGPEARPARATVEFGRRREEGKVTPGAGERAAPLLVEQRAGEGTLGGVVPQYRILIGPQ